MFNQVNKSANENPSALMIIFKKLDELSNECRINEKHQSKEHIAVIILLCVVVVLLGIIILQTFFFRDHSYVAGKYGDHCYQKNFTIKNPVYFRSLEECLEFVGK